MADEKDAEAIHIRRVTPIGPDGTYEVAMTNSLGDYNEFRVFAADEIGAYTEAKEIVRSKRKVARHILWAATVALLGLFALIGYGCSRPSNAEACIAAGKTYIETDNVGDTANVYQCK